MNEKSLYPGICLVALLILNILIAGCSQQDQVNRNLPLSEGNQSQPNPSPTPLSQGSLETTPGNSPPMTFSVSGGSRASRTSQDQTTTSEQGKLNFIDVHVHLFPTIMDVSDITSNMDKYGVTKMVNMQEPCEIYTNTPPSHEGIPDLSEKYPDKFISLYAGEPVHLLDQVATSGSYTQTDQEQYTSLLEKAMQSGKYRGFGEIALLHGWITSGGLSGKGNSGCAQVSVPGDHPWMFIMSDIAAKYNVPIDIHMEHPDVMLPGFERLLDHNRNTTIIWSHTGWITGEYSPTPEQWRELLEKHPNLYGSIKCRPYTAGDLVPLVQEDKTINDKWLQLFEDYPDRFMIGSDIKPGQRAGEFDFLFPYRQLLKDLPQDVRVKIAQGNAKRIFRI